MDSLAAALADADERCTAVHLTVDVPLLIVSIYWLLVKNDRNRCLHSKSILNLVQKLLRCTFVQVEANLIGHEHLIGGTTNERLQNISDLIGIIEKDQTLAESSK